MLWIISCRQKFDDEETRSAHKKISKSITSPDCRNLEIESGPENYCKFKILNHSKIFFGKTTVKKLKLLNKRSKKDYGFGAFKSQSQGYFFE